MASGTIKKNLSFPNFNNVIASGNVSYSQAPSFSYTIPEDGWIFFSMQKTTSGFAYANINGVSVATAYSALNVANFTTCFVPVRKGDVLTFSYTTSENAKQYYTIYAMR